MQGNQKGFLKGDLRTVQRETAEFAGSRISSTSVREAHCFTRKCGACFVHHSRVRWRFFSAAVKGCRGGGTFRAVTLQATWWRNRRMIDCPPLAQCATFLQETPVSLSELYGNKKQLSKCHSVTSTIEGCRVVGRGDEGLAWHAGQKRLKILRVYLTYPLGWGARRGGETWKVIGQFLCWWTTLLLLYLYNIILHIHIFLNSWLCFQLKIGEGKTRGGFIAPYRKMCSLDSSHW